MLEYFKTILSKVSFDGLLFEKELKKAINSLIREEAMKLRDWCYKQYGDVYSGVLDQCFNPVLN